MTAKAMFWTAFGLACGLALAWLGRCGGVPSDAPPAQAGWAVTRDTVRGPDVLVRGPALWYSVPAAADTLYVLRTDTAVHVVTVSDTVVAECAEARWYRATHTDSMLDVTYSHLVCGRVLEGAFTYALRAPTFHVRETAAPAARGGAQWGVYGLAGTAPAVGLAVNAGRALVGYTYGLDGPARHGVQVGYRLFGNRLRRTPRGSKNETRQHEIRRP